MCLQPMFTKTLSDDQKGLHHFNQLLLFDIGRLPDEKEARFSVAFNIPGPMPRSLHRLRGWRDHVPVVRGLPRRS